MKRVYIGLFLNEQLAGTLERTSFPGGQHVTLCFLLKYAEEKRAWIEECYASLIGKEEEIMVVGYGNDGKNEAYQVALPSIYRKHIIGTVPHITIGCSADGIPVDSGKLKFKSITPFIVKARLDFFPRTF